MPKYSIFNKQRGIGLIELMLSLLVIIIIIFTATRYFQVTNENLKVTQAEEMINNVVNASYKWLEGNPNFSQVNIAALVNAGLLPQNYANANSNPWKGDIEIQASGSDQSKLFLFMDGIPVASCQSLMEKMQQYAPDANCIIHIKNRNSMFSGTF